MSKEIKFLGAFASKSEAIRRQKAGRGRKVKRATLGGKNKGQIRWLVFSDR